MSDHSLGTLLTRTHFSKLWISQILTQVGINLLYFVLVLRIYERAHSSFSVSLVWLFNALPAILIGPLSGTLIDLISKKKLLIIANIAQAITVLFYLFVRNSIWPIYGVVFIYALFNQLYIPAEGATLPSLVKKRLLPLANTLFLFTMYTSLLFGFGIAGPIIAVVGRRTPFIIVSLMFVIATLAVASLPGEKRKRKLTSPAKFWDHFQEGYKFVRENNSILYPILVIVLTGIIAPMIGILSPAIAVDILGIHLLDISTRIMIPLGVGAVIGGIGTIKFLKNGRKKKVISIGLGLGALSLISLGLVVPYLQHRVEYGILASLGLGVALAMSVIPSQTFLQEHTPDHMRGRVFGVLTFSITIASFIPIMSLAAMTEFFGEQAILTVMGIVLLLAAIISAKRKVIVRRLYAK